MEETLLDETLEDIAQSGHVPDDIVFIGSLYSGHRCNWDQYKKLAACEYNSSYGAQIVATDLVIYFSDGTCMARGEYDGAEWWQYCRKFTEPAEVKEISSLFVKPHQIGWKTLEAINGVDNEFIDDDFE